MTFLLDTHVLLWWLSDDPSLSAKVRELVSDETNLIFVSAASAWEIVIKKSLGKLVAPDDLEEAFKRNDFKELPMTLQHVLMIGQIPNHHKDPFDRMLIAQAKCEGLTLITADEKLTLYNIPLIRA